jgi:lysophospholipase L1-like esterase
MEIVMQRKQVFQFWTVVLIALSSVMTTQAQINTTQVYTFGDSLTDNEFLYLFFGTPPEIYGADPMELAFEKAAEPGDQLTNFAILGSRSFEVLEQVQEYERGRAAGTLPAATLVSLQAGGNDLIDLQNGSANLFLLAATPPGVNPAADKIIRDAERNLRQCVNLVQRRGRPQIVLWTAPDVSLSPYVLSLGFSAEQLNRLRAHIAHLNQAIRTLGRRNNIAILDSSKLQQALTFNPPVLLGVTIQPTPAFGFAAAQFADPIHPTAVMNGFIANELIFQMNAEFSDNVSFYNELELANLAGLLP